MAYVWQDIKDQDVEFPNRFKIDGVPREIIPDFGTMTEPGTPVNRALLQKYEDEFKKLDELKKLDVPGRVDLFLRGDIPEGYVESSGASVSQTLYDRLYALYGYKFNTLSTGWTAHFKVIGKYAYRYGVGRKELLSNLNQTESTLTSLPFPAVTGLDLSSSSWVVSSKGFYFFGGQGNTVTNPSNQVCGLLFESEGVLNPTTVNFEAMSNYRARPTACIWKDKYIYVVGGRSTYSSGSELNSLDWYEINSDGTLTRKGYSTYSYARFIPIVFVAGDYLWIYGGYDSTGTATKTGCRIPLNPSTGVPGTTGTISDFPVICVAEQANFYYSPVTNFNDNIVWYNQYKGVVNGSSIAWTTPATRVYNIAFGKAFVGNSSKSDLDLNGESMGTINDAIYEQPGEFQLPDLRSKLISFANTAGDYGISSPALFGSSTRGAINPVPCIKY